MQKLEAVSEQQGVGYFPLEMTRKITPSRPALSYTALLFTKRKTPHRTYPYP